MTLNEFLDWMDAVRPSPWSHEQKTVWVNDLESSLWSQILLASPGQWQIKTAARDGDKPLLLPDVWRKLYGAYVGAMMDFAAGENASYANSMALYNGYLAELGAWYGAEFDPAKQGPVWKKMPAAAFSALEEPVYLGTLPAGSAVLAAECRVTEAFDGGGRLCLGTEEEPALLLTAEAEAAGTVRSPGLTLSPEAAGLYLSYTGTGATRGRAEVRLLIQPGAADSTAARTVSDPLPAGRPGKSAYEIAVANGFEGTAVQWLESLKGIDGEDLDLGEEFDLLASIQNEALTVTACGPDPTIDTVTYGGLSLREIFETNSIIQGGDFENGWPTVDGAEPIKFLNLDESCIQGDVVDTGSYALKLDATGDYEGKYRYFQFAVHEFTREHTIYNAFRARVDEYTQGQTGVQSVFNKYAPTEGTLNAWVSCTRQSTISASDDSTVASFGTFIGCMGVSSLDNLPPILVSYIDNVSLLDLTAIFGAGGEPDKGQMDALYDLYIRLKKGTAGKNAYTLAPVPDSGEYTPAECLYAFKKAMNKKAASLGMTNSAFESPSGLPGGAMGNNYSTAADTMKLGLAALGSERLMEILGAYSYTFRTGGTKVRNLTTTSLYHGGTLPKTLGQAGYYLFGGKGGSLKGSISGQGSHGILNALALCGAGDRQVVVSVLGQWLYDADGNSMSIGSIVAQALDVVYALLEGTAPENVTLGTALSAAIGRSEYPVSVAACVVPAGNQGVWAAYGTEAILNWPTSYSSTPDEVHALASVSKVLTALIVLEYISDLDERVTIVEEDYVGGSGKELYAGETLSCRDLMYLMLLESNNNAATALGRAVGERLLRRGESIDYSRPVYTMKT